MFDKPLVKAPVQDPAQSRPNNSTEHQPVKANHGFGAPFAKGQDFSLVPARASGQLPRGIPATALRYPRLQPKLRASSLDDPEAKDADKVAGEVTPQKLGQESKSAPNRQARDFSLVPSYATVKPITQTKLAINKPNDEHEQEANQIADELTGMPATYHDGNSMDGRKPEARSITPRVVRRKSGQSSQGATIAPALVHEALHSPAQKLDQATLNFMEPRFGSDFSSVRVHTDETAQRSARSLNSHAYTVGQEIVFGAGRFSPETTEGKRLLSHELTHVLQQAKEDTVSLSVQRQIASDIPVASSDFWVHMMTRAMTGLTAWIGDTRQALNQFVVDMGEEAKTENSSGFLEVLENWLWSLSTETEYAVNIFETIRWLAETVPAAFASSIPLNKTESVAEWSQIETRRLQDLSDKATNVESDLPIYKALRNARGLEDGTTLPTDWHQGMETPKNPSVSPQEQSSHRRDAITQLNGAIEHLPRPDTLRQKLIMQWINKQNKSASTPSVRIEYSSFFIAKTVQGHTMYHEAIDLPVDFVGAPPKNQPFLVGAANPDATLRALKGAYGAGALLHKLPISFHLRLIAVRNYDVGRQQISGDEATTVNYIKLQADVNPTWVPVGPLESVQDTDLLKAWLESGKKPTMGEMRAL